MINFEDDTWCTAAGLEKVALLDQIFMHTLKNDRGDERGIEADKAAGRGKGGGREGERDRQRQREPHWSFYL